MLGIYMIKNTRNNKKYIGKSVDVNKRLATHIRHLKKDKHHNKFLQEDFNKYGSSVFKTYVLRELSSKEDLDKWEMFYINLLSSQCNAKGYNISESYISLKDKQSILKKMEKERVDFIESNVNTAKEITINYCDTDGSNIFIYDNNGISAVNNIKPKINETFISCTNRDFNRAIEVGEHCIVIPEDNALDDTIKKSDIDICLLIANGMLVSIYTGKIYGFDATNSKEIADEFRVEKEEGEDYLRRYVGDTIYDNKNNVYRILRGISNFSVNI